MILGASTEQALKLYAAARKGVMLPAVTWEKATSASEYAAYLAAEFGVDLDDIATELPEWLVEAIAGRLQETFAQPYWMEVAVHTRDQIENIVKQGITDGLSSREVAKLIGEAAPDRAGYRAMNAARTETGNALNYGHHASIQQLGEDTGLEMASEWLSVCGSTSREEHCALDGTQAPVDEPFNVGGYEGRWPGDEMLPPEQRCNCQCVPGYCEVTPVGGVVALTRMLYDGPLVEIITRSGRELHVTPNHPVLTSRGWIAAGKVEAGMHVLSQPPAGHVLAGKDEQHKPTTIKEMFEAFSSAAARIETVRRLPLQFHGDAQHGKGEVDAVIVHVKLPLPSAAERLKQRTEGDLEVAASQLGISKRSLGVSRPRFSPSAALGVRVRPQNAMLSKEPLNHRPGNAATVSNGGLPTAGQVLGNDGLLVKRDTFGARLAGDGFGVGPQLYAGGTKSRNDRPSRAAVHGGDLLARHPLVDVHIDEVVSVRERSNKFSGHVYDLQTTERQYAASGIVVHNCTVVSAFVGEELDPDDRRRLEPEDDLEEGEDQ